MDREGGSEGGCGRVILGTGTPLYAPNMAWFADASSLGVCPTLVSGRLGFAPRWNAGAG